MKLKTTTNSSLAYTDSKRVTKIHIGVELSGEKENTVMSKYNYFQVSGVTNS